MKRIVIVLSLMVAAFVGCASWIQAHPRQADLTAGIVHIAAEKPVIFQVEIASKPADLERGLMFRKTLPDRHGMLFIFPQESVVRFWMKNTYVPLDMIFIDAKGTVVKIAADAVPLSTADISSDVPALTVLEVPAGSAKKYGIYKGNKVSYD